MTLGDVQRYRCEQLQWLFDRPEVQSRRLAYRLTAEFRIGARGRATKMHRWRVRARALYGSPPAATICYTARPTKLPSSDTYESAKTAALRTINHNAPAEITYRENLKGIRLKVQCTMLCSILNRKNTHAEPTYTRSTWLVVNK